MYEVLNWLLRVLFVFFVIGLVIQYWEDLKTLALLGLIGLGAVSLASLWKYSQVLGLIALVLIFGLVVQLTKAYIKSNRERRKKINERAEDIVTRHAQALHVKKLQKSRRDDYGNLLEEGWIKEKEYFHNQVVVPQLTKVFGEGATKDYDNMSTASLIEAALEKYERKHSLKDLDISRLTPYEFEAYCARLLNDAGWTARATQGSGDQGIDVIGEKNGVKAVFQIKMYSSPVGNKAVQEVIAGKAFASTDLAYVVSNAGYTPSAKELANKSGVKLLHYSELGTLRPHG